MAAKTIADLERDIVQLRRQVEQLQASAKRDAGVNSGMWTVNRPFLHTGELLGFFGTTPNTQAPVATTLADALAVLRRYGLTR